MASPPIPYLTREQYFLLDSRAERPSEYYDGEMFEVKACTVQHGEILVNLCGILGAQLRNSQCRPVASPLRVRIPNGPYTYPDMVVACCKMELEPGVHDTLVNPVVLFEILSGTTANFDAGAKGRMYRSIPSLLDYVVIEQSRSCVERYSRQPGGKWLIETVEGLDSVLAIESIGCQLPLSEIYFRVQLDAGTSSAN